MGISIHALREEGDQDVMVDGGEEMVFLSTPSARRATHQVDHVRHIGVISIHALREEGDWVLASAMLAASIFLSTPSARRATLHNPATNVGRLQFLSTPSARRATAALLPLAACRGSTFLSTPSARRATVVQQRAVALKAFLSTPSARRATGQHLKVHIDQVFLSTPSARRATKTLHDVEDFIDISIHALREEGDHLPRSWHLAAANFYPRPPRGGRPLSRALTLSTP